MTRAAHLPAHTRLLLLTARMHPNEAEGAAIQILMDAGVDWDAYLATVEEHRLSALVFESLDALRPAGLPEKIRGVLQRRAKVNAIEAMRAAGEVKRIATGFAEAGIVATVLKGLALSHTIFGNPNTRHVGDIDLLTSEQRLPQQIELLRGLGYERINPTVRLTSRRLRTYARFWKDLTFRNETTGFELDLHWRLFNNRFHPANRLLDGARRMTVTVFGVRMQSFTAEDQFLYAAAHGMTDAWTYWKSLADVAGFLREFDGAQMDGALVRAAQLGLLPQVSAAIYLAREWMGGADGNARLLPLNEPQTRRIYRRVRSMMLLQGSRPDRDSVSPAQWMRLEMDLIPGVRALAEMLLRFVWRPRVWAAVDLPDSLFWCYPALGLLMLPRKRENAAG